MTPEISDVIIFLLLLKFFSDSSVSVTIWMQAVCEERLIDEILLKEKAVFSLGWALLVSKRVCSENTAFLTSFLKWLQFLFFSLVSQS